MTLVELEKAVALQLQHSSVNTLQSLIAQNHVYGCFIVMEDICQGTNQGPTKDTLEKNFAFLGIRHGFVMDTKLVLDPLPEYQAAWLAYFQELLAVRDMDMVDKTEDALIDVIQRHCTVHTFFMKAIQTGVLPQDVMGHIVEMLLTGATEFVIVANEVENAVEHEVRNALANTVANEVRNAVANTVANTVIPVKKSNFARTRHSVHVTVPTKKYLSKTRRVLKK